MLHDGANQRTRREDALDEAFIYKKAISKETYERQSDKLSQDIALAEIAQQEARLEQLDVQGALWRSLSTS